MKCSNCKYLRTNIKITTKLGLVSKGFNDHVHPCNRYPQNIMRAENEPACGEFKPNQT